MRPGIQLANFETALVVVGGVPSPIRDRTWLIYVDASREQVGLRFSVSGLRCPSRVTRVEEISQSVDKTLI